VGSKNIEAMLQIPLEGPNEVINDIINDDALLWKNDSKYCFLYANPCFYLNSPNGSSVSDASCMFGAIDTNGSGTQMF